MSSISEDIIRRTLLGVANTLGVRIDIPDETIADLAATLQAEIDRLEAVETESFEFLNELALAFRAAENHPRPQYAPVLEGVRAVLAHLTAAGRLVPAGGMALTAEQVEDVRTVANCALQYGNIASREAAARLRALFPATEPAEDAKPCGSNSVTLGWCKLTARHEGLHTNGTYLWGTPSEPDPPAPAEPAEEETKAGPWTVQLPEGMTMEQWIESLPDEAPGLLAAVREVRERLGISSPVVPAPTETGPHIGGAWLTDGETKDAEMILRMVSINRHFSEWARNRCREISTALAPFVAAEEG